ncbi:MAG: PepSY domain-containing protein [Acidobacteria bacterium]|nr:PepSY domain-containing protein [Acidobacteriota bacterium]
MKIRRLHRIAGVILLLPMLGWAATGLVFFIKPGYSGAYEVLAVRTYPLGEGFSVAANPEWLEFRCIRTILGNHVIARTRQGWVHLDANDLRPKERPAEDEIRRLVEDSFTANPARYGRIREITEAAAITDTGVEIRLDWQRLTLQQRGRDTNFIDLLYRIHYLQWTGAKSLDRALGLAGLALLIALAGLGGFLAWKRKREITEQTE